jgi:hypothetical protein
MMVGSENSTFAPLTAAFKVRGFLPTMQMVSWQNFLVLFQVAIETFDTNDAKLQELW